MKNKFGRCDPRHTPNRIQKATLMRAHFVNGLRGRKLKPPKRVRNFQRLLSVSALNVF
jgi:hypothetical protein